MMQKNIFQIVIVLILIISPFVFGEDLDGDGIEDSEQNLCGDGSCQDWEENETTCPVDCTAGASNPDYMGNFISSTEQSKEERFSLNKILIIATVIVIVIGAIFLIIFLLKKKKKSPKKKPTSVASDSSVEYSSSV
jgi:hypothetical protein